MKRRDNWELFQSYFEVICHVILLTLLKLSTRRHVTACSESIKSNEQIGIQTLEYQAEGERLLNYTKTRCGNQRAPFASCNIASTPDSRFRKAT